MTCSHSLTLTLVPVLGVDVGGSGPQFGLEELKLVSSMVQKLIARGEQVVELTASE